MRTLVRLIAVAALSLSIGLGAAACNRPAANDNTGDRVEKALEDANLKDVNVDFDKDANVVHLKGKVDSADQKQQAERIAETAVGTSGKVLNELTVEGMNEDRMETADDQIKNRLNDAVNANERLADQNDRLLCEQRRRDRHWRGGVAGSEGPDWPAGEGDTRREGLRQRADDQQGQDSRPGP